MPENRVSTQVRPAAALTNSYVAGTEINFKQHISQVNLYVDLTLGSLTSAEIKVEFSDDGTNWYQETRESLTGGTATMTVFERTFTADAAARISFPVKDKWMRVSAKGTGTVTGSEMAITAVYGLI